MRDEGSHIIYHILRPCLAIGGFAVWSFLMIDGRALSTTTTLALLCLIIIMAGLGNHVTAITGALGGISGGGGVNRGGEYDSSREGDRNE